MEHTPRFTRYTDRRARPTGNFELYAWYFMRVSGVVLLFVAVFHLLYMHVVIGVENINFEVVARRWQNPGWRLFDMALLVFALSHGVNGTRTVIDDYFGNGPTNTFLKGALYITAAVFLLMGLHIIVTFQMPASLQ